MYKKIDQLLCLNKVTNAPSMQHVHSICTSLMHAFVDYHCVRKFDYATEQVTSIQVFPLTNDPYSNTYHSCWKNHPSFLSRSQNDKNPQSSPAYLPLLVFKIKDMIFSLLLKLHLRVLI